MRCFCCAASPKHCRNWNTCEALFLQTRARYFLLVKLYQGIGDEANAGKTFAALQQNHPDSALVDILLGESYDIQENWQAGIREYQKALQQASTTARLHFDLGFLYWENHQYTESTAELKKELEISHGFAPALFYLGDIALNSDRPEDALKLFERSSASDPDCLRAEGLGKAKPYYGWIDPRKRLSNLASAARVDRDTRCALLVGDSLPSIERRYKSPGSYVTIPGALEEQ